MPISGSTVPNRILRDIDTINGMELTNMMSAIPSPSGIA